MPCPLQAPLDGSELPVLDTFICCRAYSKKPPTGTAPRATALNAAPNASAVLKPQVFG